MTDSVDFPILPKFCRFWKEPVVTTNAIFFRVVASFFLLVETICILLSKIILFKSSRTIWKEKFLFPIFDAIVCLYSNSSPLIKLK